MMDWLRNNGLLGDTPIAERSFDSPFQQRVRGEIFQGAFSCMNEQFATRSIRPGVVVHLGEFPRSW